MTLARGGGSADAQMAKKRRVSHFAACIFQYTCRAVMNPSALHSPDPWLGSRYPQYYHKMI